MSRKIKYNLSKPYKLMRLEVVSLDAIIEEIDKFNKLHGYKPEHIILNRDDAKDLQHASGIDVRIGTCQPGHALFRAIVRDPIRYHKERFPL